MLDSREQVIPKVEERPAMKKTLTSLSKAVIFIALCATLAFLLAAGMVLFRSGESTQAESAPSGADRPESADSAQSAQSADGAPLAHAQKNTASIDVTIPTDAIDHAFSRTAEVLAAPADTFDPGDSLANTALEDLQATAEEWNLLGYTQEGKPEVSDVQVLKVGDTGTTMQVLACVDSSNVRVLDENGSEVSDEQAPTRSRFLFDLEFIDGKWKVTHQSFPENPEC